MHDEPRWEHQRVEAARRDVGVTVAELWLMYFSLGGNATEGELASYLRGAAQLADPQYEVLAHAINERYRDLGRDHPVPYGKP